jgi:hypothetical protein
MTESEQNHLKNLTAALIQAGGTTPPVTSATNKPSAPDRSKANLRRIRAEETGLRCPSCGYEGPEDEFDTVELDGDSESEGFETDESAGRTDGDDPAEAKLSRALLKAAGYQPEQSAGEKPKYKQLTREEIQAILSKAVQNLRR